MTDSSPKQEPPYGLRMPPDLKARVKAAAEANNRSMNAEIVATLEEKYPNPKADLELSTLASWLEYVHSGGPDEEFDERLFEVNQRLESHPATKHLRLAILVQGEGDDMRAEVILGQKRPEEDQELEDQEFEPDSHSFDP